MNTENRRVEKTSFTCPDCGGAIQRVVQGTLTQYRCRVGHLYSPETALEVHADREENTLWTAVVLLEEGAELAEEVAKADKVPAPERLRSAAAIKRRLAEQARTIATEFGKASVPDK